MTAIIPYQQFFDVSKILQELVDLNIEDYENITQLSLTHREDYDNWVDGNGSLWCYTERKFTSTTSEYTTLNKALEGTYIANVIDTVKSLAQIDGVNIGRIRVLTLKEKTCYSLHKDPDEFRYHIPLLTNEKCFFVNGNTVEYMPKAGQLYKFRTYDLHTAVNASFLKRTHLVFDTYPK